MLRNYTRVLGEEITSGWENHEMFSISVGNEVQKVPIYKNFPQKNSNRVLVTAGFDGDEYDGIRAAFLLASRIRRLKLHFELTILPVANPWGFFAKTSNLPFDGSFPKYYYPGSNKGNYSQQLVHSLLPLFNKAQLWIDLHGGSSVENLLPFVCGYKTDNSQLNLVISSLLNVFAGKDRVYFQAHHRWQKIQSLARNNIGYILSEAGQLGTTSNEMTSLHVERTIRILKTIDKSRKSTIHFPLTVFDRYWIRRNANWSPQVFCGNKIEKGSVLGTWSIWYFPLTIKIRAKNSGTVLWMRKKSMLKLNECVCEVALD